MKQLHLMLLLIMAAASIFYSLNNHNHTPQCQHER